MTVWVAAVEYTGADLEPLHPAPRRPVLEHAYDLETGRLAHSGDGQLRVGFTRPTRGWPAPAQLTRCAACTIAVARSVTSAVTTIVGRTVADLTRWAMRFAELVDDDMWLWAPPAEPPGT